MLGGLKEERLLSLLKVAHEALKHFNGIVSDSDELLSIQYLNEIILAVRSALFVDDKGVLDEIIQEFVGEDSKVAKKEQEDKSDYPKSIKLVKNLLRSYKSENVNTLISNIEEEIDKLLKTRFPGNQNFEDVYRKVVEDKNDTDLLRIRCNKFADVLLPTYKLISLWLVILDGKKSNKNKIEKLNDIRGKILDIPLPGIYMPRQDLFGEKPCVLVKVPAPPNSTRTQPQLIINVNTYLVGILDDATKKAALFALDEKKLSKLKTQTSLNNQEKLELAEMEDLLAIKNFLVSEKYEIIPYKDIGLEYPKDGYGVKFNRRNVSKIINDCILWPTKDEERKREVPDQSGQEKTDFHYFAAINIESARNKLIHGGVLYYLTLPQDDNLKKIDLLFPSGRT